MYVTNRLFEIGLVLVVVLGSVENSHGQQDPGQTSKTIRVATFNVSLYGKRAGEIRRRLSDRHDDQAKRIAAIVQTVRPDILLVNELDYESDSAPARLLAENYFAVAQPDADGNGELRPIEYPHYYSSPSNTGIDSERDLNRDGKLGSGNDAWGYGVYEGQYAMSVFSRFPIDVQRIRTFQKLRWKDLPNAIRPMEASGRSYYSDELWSVLRLSSKNHIDVPIRIGDRTLHVLASHPTPPVFDGPEDRNGSRNHDEVEFWNHYLTNASQSSGWMIDDAGRAGGLDKGFDFVVLGDLNADPVDGSGRREAIRRLIAHERVSPITPKCDEKATKDRSDKHQGNGDLREKTADFGRNGMMRVDFVLPSRSMDPRESGVFWPAKSDPRSAWLRASDHRMVWVDCDLGSAKVR